MLVTSQTICAYTWIAGKCIKIVTDRKRSWNWAARICDSTEYGSLLQVLCDVTLKSDLSCEICDVIADQLASRA